MIWLSERERASPLAVRELAFVNAIPKKNQKMRGALFFSQNLSSSFSLLRLQSPILGGFFSIQFTCGVPARCFLSFCGKSEPGESSEACEQQVQSESERNSKTKKLDRPMDAYYRFPSLFSIILSLFVATKTT